MPPFEVACDKNRDTVRDRLRQTPLHVFVFCFFFPVIIKFSEPLFRQLLLFEEPVIFYRPGRGGKGTSAGFWGITWFSGGNGEDIIRRKQSMKGEL